MVEPVSLVGYGAWHAFTCGCTVTGPAGWVFLGVVTTAVVIAGAAVAINNK